MDISDFGEFLRRLRRKKGVVLRKASQGIGLSPSYLCRLELGQVAPPPPHVIRKLADFYSVPEEALLLRARNRRYVPENMAAEESTQTKAELLALYRVIQNLDTTIMMDLLKRAYTQQGKTEEDAVRDVEDALMKIKQELPRLRRGRENLLAADVVPRRLSAKRIDAIAEGVLAEFGMTKHNYVPPTPIEELVEQLDNVNLVLTEEWDGRSHGDDPQVLGMSRWSRRFPGEAEIVISARLFDSEQSTTRARLHFTLAHEAFHVLEHLPLMKTRVSALTLRRAGVLPPQVIAVRPSIREVKLRAWVRDTSGPRRLSTNEDWREWQANRFAAAILVPAWAIAKELEERFEVASLAVPDDMNERQYAFEVATTRVSASYVFDKSLCELFQVSGQAMAIRLLQLGLVNPHHR